MKKTLYIVLFFILWLDLNSFSQQLTYAEKLGYPKNSRLLILHVDDAGMSYDSNLGVETALDKGIANSCSIMMPCPWVPDFMHYLKLHPNTDAGLHLTLTSEWKEYRWGPVSGKSQVPGLVDQEGDLWPDVADVVKHASPDEVEKEINAQLNRSLSMGWKPTHLDAHMGAIFSTPAFIQRYVKLGIENKIPVMFPGGHSTLIKKQMNIGETQMQMMHAVGEQLWAAGLPVLDDLHNESYDWQIPKEIAIDTNKLKDFKTEKYILAIKSLKPGITMMIMHCTEPSEIFARISDSGPIRKGDLLAMLNPVLKAEIAKEGIILVTWRELMDKRSKVK